MIQYPDFVTNSEWDVYIFFFGNVISNTIAKKVRTKQDKKKNGFGLVCIRRKCIDFWKFFCFLELICGYSSVRFGY